MERSKKFVYDYLAELSQGDNLCRVHNNSGISLCLCIVQPSPNHLRRPRGSNSGRDGTKTSRAKSEGARVYKWADITCKPSLVPILPVISSSCSDYNRHWIYEDDSIRNLCLVVCPSNFFAFFVESFCLPVSFFP